MLARYDHLFGAPNEYDGTIADIGNVIGGATPSKKKPEYYCADGIGWITPRDLSNTTDKFIAHGADDITQLGYDSCSVKMLPAGTVLFSSRAPIGYIAIAADNVTTNQGFKSVVPRDEIGTAFVYCFLKRNKDRIADAGSGTTFPEVSGKTMAGIELSLPKVELCAEFSEWAEPLLNQQRCLEEENRTLEKLRDTLLPKLMSGEIDVSDIELPTLPNNHLSKRLAISKSIAPSPPLKGPVMENAINLVLAEMQPFLNCEQLKRLSEALRFALKPRHETSVDLLRLFLTAKEVEGCSHRTISYYENTLRHMTDAIDKPYTQICSDDLRSYLNDYEATRNAGKVTIDNIRRILSSFFTWLEDEDYIVKSPVRRIRRIKTATVAKEVLSDEDLEALRDGCTNPRDLAIVDLLATTGMRIGELVRLDIDDIDLQERECVVTGKGNKQRPVYFDARAKLHLKAYLESRTDECPALFVSLDSAPTRMSIGGIETRLRNLGRACGLSKVHPHKFRRTLATHAIDKGMPIEQVQKLLGHARIDTTMHYAMVNQNNVKASHRKYLE